MSLKSNYLNLLSNVNSRANLIAVTKNQEISVIQELYDLGQRDFGENRVEALAEKAKLFKANTDIRWHFIGELQSKKVPLLCKVPQLYLIHSVSKIKTIKLLIKHSVVSQIKIPIFLQVNISRELQKSGFLSFQELKVAYEYARSQNYPVMGLMGMAPIVTDNYDKSAFIAFTELVAMRDKLGSKLELSMGMSRDYNVAMSLGSNWLRVGSSLYS